ncbi:MAG TPA: biotin--[acetyl-CoA-carboxylase] ligase [Solirubrobacteraceae bacterium]|nr:biotin--[acetyl-CoA-carboxylase] ligase [Solirubrobacteraceae bacterium]
MSAGPPAPDAAPDAPDVLVAGDAGDAPDAFVLGAPRVHLRRTGSTNDRARELALAGAPHGTLVTTREQTAGRGRQGRRWSAPAGSALLMSLLLRSPPSLLPLIAAIAACDALGASAAPGERERIRIKWPNDIVVEERPARAATGGARLAKLAGILVEGRPQERWAVLGIGANVAVRLEDLPPELRPASARAPREPGEHGGALPAATLGLEPADVEPTLARLLAALRARLREPAELTLAAWRERDALRGREVAWAHGHGRAEGVDGAGRLIVALAGPAGRTALSAGEVHLREVS